MSEVKEVSAEDTQTAVTAPKGKAKKNDEPTTEELAPVAGATDAWYEEQAAKSKSNKNNGGTDVVISLTNTTKVRMLENHGYMKAGSEQEWSDAALGIHTKAGAKFEKL